MVSLDREFKGKTLNELLSGRVIIRQGGLLSKLQDISQFSEIGTRLGEFGRALEKTSDPLKAAKATREVTVDFGRIGKDTRIANQLIAFLNARVQGTIQAVKSALRHPVRASVIGMGLGSVPATMLYLHNRQYPEWNDIQDYEKRQNWIVLYGQPGQAKMFEIPKDYIIGQLFGNVTENFLTYMDKTDPNAIQNLLTNVGNFLSPASNIGEIIPSAVKPVMEHAFNFNTFLQRQIVPEYQKALPPEAQYNKGTREVAKIIGSRIGISPNIIDNYLYGYLPGVFSEVINLVDFALGGRKIDEIIKLPFVRIFSISGTGKINQEIKNAYYGIQDKKATLSSIARNENYTSEQKQGLLQKQIQEMGSLINKLNNYVRMQGGETGIKFEETPTIKVPYSPPGLAKPIGATEASPVGIAKVSPIAGMENMDVLIAKEQLRYSDQQSAQIGNTYLYKPEGWKLGDSIKAIDLSFQPTPPILTGLTELDKKAISKFNGEITQKVNNIYDLYQMEKLTKEEANNQITQLKNIQKKSTTTGKKAKKGAAITIKKISAPKPIKISLLKGTFKTNIKKIGRASCRERV
jgi:hypothetical protein